MKFKDSLDANYIYKRSDHVDWRTFRQHRELVRHSLKVYVEA